MKKIISFVIALFAVVSMSAQNYAGSSSFLDNWSIGVRVVFRLILSSGIHLRVLLPDLNSTSS